MDYTFQGNDTPKLKKNANTNPNSILHDGFVLPSIDIGSDQVAWQAFPGSLKNIHKNRGMNCLTSRDSKQVSKYGASMNISSSTSELLDYHNTSQRK